MTVSDGTLVLGVRNGDRSAFAELYDRRARLIRAICYDTTRDIHSAADLTQEVFLRAYRNLGRLHDPDRFGAWLVGVCRQVCREWRRGQRRRRRAMAGFAERARAEAAQNGVPEPRLVELRDQIAGVLGTAATAVLTHRERLALHAFYLQERSAEEARRVLGLSRSGFYRVLSSACERLRCAVRRQEVTG